MPIEFRTVDPSALRDLAPEVLDETGRLRVMPASFYASTSVEERAVFGLRYGLYGLPTVELVEWLKALIGGRFAIEVGAGTGVLAEALGIRATDNRMQEWPEIRHHYVNVLRHPVIQYGPLVEKFDALDAVNNLKPQVVISCWVTHKYDPLRHEAEGNQFGVAEEEIVRNCETYVSIGNTHVHRGKRIWQLPHVRIEPPWLYSRAHNGSKDYVAVWGKVPPELVKLAS